jgi:FtsP/CotA-like multicopper oxidase with cupredoxin domain
MAPNDPSGLIDLVPQEEGSKGFEAMVLAGVPGYAITPSVASINEGQVLTTSVQTTNVAPGTLLYWSLSGTGISDLDFSKGALVGSAVVDAAGAFAFSHTLANDLRKEGAETLNIKLFTNAARTTQVGATAAVTINDTSLTPTVGSTVPTYTIRPSATALNEGLVLTTTIQTTNVRAGTVLYWSLSGTGITEQDLSRGALFGFSPVDATGKITLVHAFSNDLSTEGPETLKISLFRDPGLINPVGAPASVTIRDTSITPAQPLLSTYTIKPSAVVLNEGVLLTTTVQTTNVVPGTTVYWTVSGNGITNTDLSSGTLIGLATVDSKGQFKLSHRLANDLTTEGPETLQINLFSDPKLASPLASAAVLINDTSRSRGAATATLTPSLTTLSEGQAVTTAVTTTNLADGTILYYQLSGVGIDPADFGVGTISGQVVIKAGKASVSHIIAKDYKTEGSETIKIQLFTDKPGGTLIGNAAAVTVQDTSLALNVATEVVQPRNTPFPVRKWASAVPVPTLKRPDYVGVQPDVWGTKFAPQPSPGGLPALAADVDPTQASYGGIAPEFYNQTVAGTTTPYYTTGQLTSWYSQREGARPQVVVDGANQTYLTEIFGYDSTMPGSTFKTRVGQPVVVRHWNDLPLYPGMPAGMVQRESVHLHGGHNPAHVDGYPSFVINPGMYRDYYYANTVPMGSDGKPDMSESPSTMWYHDHGEDITDLNVVMGLAGFWLSFDDAELNLIKNHVLPGWWKTSAEWNEQEFMENNSPYDIPLALSDRQFNADGSFFYDGFPIGNNTDGYLGDVMLVNGKSYPYLVVEQTQVRMRMLGASTGRIWHLSIQDANGVMQPHLRVGNDTWLLPNPIQMNEFTMSPAQRADVVMDFSGYAPGTELYLVNTAEQNKGTGPQGTLDTIGTTGFSERIMKIVVAPRTAITPTNAITVSTPLRENTPILPAEISNRRTFEFGRSNGLWLINQTHFDSQIVNAVMAVGVAEEWTLVNGSGGWWHPIHIHLESHQVQTINGRRPSADYFPEKQFKSDTTLLGPNSSATIFMKFRTFEGPFVFHCHTLQHEDSMMMFNFDPNLDGAAYRDGDPIPSDRNYTVYPYPSAHHPGVVLTGPPTAGTAAHAAGFAAIGADPWSVHGTEPLAPYSVAFHPGLHSEIPQDDSLTSGFDAAASTRWSHDHGLEPIAPYAVAYHPGLHATLPSDDTLLAGFTTAAPNPHHTSPSLPAVTSAPADDDGVPQFAPAVLALFAFSSWGTNAGEVMNATAQDSYLNGRDGSDYLRGDKGNDMLVGGDGDDLLSGGNGDDLLAGEYGDDVLTGGAGRDGFYYISADPDHTDRITDFQTGSDFISLHHALVNTNGFDNATWTFIGAEAFSGKTGQVRFVDSLLTIDLNGDTLSDINIQIPGLTGFDPCWLDVPTATASLGSNCATPACDPICPDPNTSLACAPDTTLDYTHQEPVC